MGNVTYLQTSEYRRNLISIIVDNTPHCFRWVCHSVKLPDKSCPLESAFHIGSPRYHLIVPSIQTLYQRKFFLLDFIRLLGGNVAIKRMCLSFNNICNVRFVFALFLILWDAILAGGGLSFPFLSASNSLLLLLHCIIQRVIHLYRMDKIVLIISKFLNSGSVLFFKSNTDTGGWWLYKNQVYLLWCLKKNNCF